MKEREALKLALEALELCNGAETVEGVVIYTDKEISAIKEALMSFQDGAQPEQEPVAWMTDRDTMYFDKEDARRDCDGFILPLYTTPPQRPSRSDMTWVGLTDDRVEELIDSLFHFDGTRWSTDTPRAVIQEIIKECE